MTPETDTTQDKEVQVMDVEEVLQKQKKYKSSAVAKHDDLTYDLGNLLAIDSHPIDADAIATDPAKHLRKIGRENLQLLLNKVFVLPTRRVEEGVIAELPEPKTLVPREKHVPQAKAPTKWEAYRRLKGIQQKKKSRMVFDENLGEYKPRWGYQRVNDSKEDWVMEAKGNGALDNEESDPFLRQKQDKKKKLEKQQDHESKNRLRVADAGLKSLPGVLAINNQSNPKKGIKPFVDKPTLAKAVDLANISTASIGRFDKQLPGQKPVKKRSKMLPEDHKKEKDKSLMLLDRVLKKSEKPADVAKAANNIVAEEHKENARKKRKLETEKSANKQIKRLTKKKKVK